MEKERVLEAIGQRKLVPVIRTATTDDARGIIDVLADAGITIFEITLTIPHGIRLIEELSQKRQELLVGAGTFLSEEQARASVSAGAKFVVSPILDRSVVEYCNRSGVCSIPAGQTPNEVYAAGQAGADAVKVFPCGSAGGVSHLKALKSVFPELKLIPTGGICVSEVPDYLNAGAFAVGVGSDLADQNLLRSGRTQAIIDRVKALLNSVAAT
jgi:2-dehydro-3-deoxyphosphogluconate aldolase/(4S)-4-hydroxy-2-oxoglutarate aldolase